MRALAALVLLAPTIASAKEESIIKQVDEHPSYIAELDAHGLFAYWGGPLSIGRVGSVGFGPGFRASFNILKDGFLPNVNDSVAIGVGADLVFDIDNAVRFVTPVVLQWNFWLTQHWSVFAEPGVAFEFPMSAPQGPEPIYVSPALFVGGRYNFNDHVTLTLRLGYPMSTIGVSFLL